MKIENLSKKHIWRTIILVSGYSILTLYLIPFITQDKFILEASTDLFIPDAVMFGLGIYTFKFGWKSSMLLLVVSIVTIVMIPLATYALDYTDVMANSIALLIIGSFGMLVGVSIRILKKYISKITDSIQRNI